MRVKRARGAVENRGKEACPRRVPRDWRGVEVCRRPFRKEAEKDRVEASGLAASRLEGMLENDTVHRYLRHPGQPRG